MTPVSNNAPSITAPFSEVQVGVGLSTDELTTARTEWVYLSSSTRSNLLCKQQTDLDIEGKSHRLMYAQLVVRYLVEDKQWTQRVISHACGGHPTQALVSQLTRNTYRYVPSNKMLVNLRLALDRSNDGSYDPYYELSVKQRTANCRWNEHTTTFMASLLLSQSDPFQYRSSCRDDTLINDQRKKCELPTASPAQIKNKIMHLKSDLKENLGVFARAKGQALAREHNHLHDNFHKLFNERVQYNGCLKRPYTEGTHSRPFRSWNK